MCGDCTLLDHLHPVPVAVKGGSPGATMVALCPLCGADSKWPTVRMAHDRLYEHLSKAHPKEVW
jgi:hypothetical protein